MNEQAMEAAKAFAEGALQGIKRNKIVLFPDPILRKKAQPVTQFDETISKLAVDMFLVLNEFSGLGLSASQIGTNLAICTYKVDNKEGVLINPSIVSASEEKTSVAEGCLSLPGTFIVVPRSKKVTVKYQTVEGKEETLEAEGLLATCLQHEIDHLNGKTILDYVSKVKRDVITRKMQKIQKQLKIAKKLKAKMVKNWQKK